MPSGKTGSLDEVKQKILDYFIKKQKSGSVSVTSSEISIILNKNLTYVRGILRELEDANLIERVEKGKPDWQLTSEYLKKCT